MKSWLKMHDFARQNAVGVRYSVSGTNQNYEVLTDNSVATLAWRALHSHLLYSLTHADQLRRLELITSDGM